LFALFSLPQTISRPQPFTDLLSTPFSKSPVQIHSAWTRYKGEALKWKNILRREGVRKMRKAKGFAPQPLTQEEEELNARNTGKRGKKKKAAGEQAEEEEGGEEEEEEEDD
jgi:hypothetical protein